MLKIILADNQAIFRAGAAKVLAVEEDLRVVAQAENAEKLNAALDSFRAGLVIFAAGMNCDVRQVLESAKKQKTRVVAVAESPDGVADLLRHGVHGVIYRNISGPALIECVRKVAKGESWRQDGEAAE